MRRFSTLLAVGLTVVALMVAGLLAAPVSATVQVLCKGVTTAEVAKCNPDYAAVMKDMHWRMYGGHNCVNYVAWQLGVNGVPEPTILMGNARDWAANAKKLGYRVDSTPAAGSIGVWPGRNHATYIAEVGANYVITHEDNYPGYYPKGLYQELKIFTGDSSYPAQFIHFKDLIAGGSPTIAGTPRVGETLTAHDGSWVPADLTFQYRWLRDGVAISTGTKSTYVIQPEDLGHQLSYRVRGSKSDYVDLVRTSASTSTVAAGQIVNAAPPVLSGGPSVGSTLTASAGQWSPADVAVGYQWRRDGDVIAGAQQHAYALTPADLGARITVRVTAAKDGYLATAATAPQSVTVDSGVADNVVRPTISGVARVGTTLTAHDGSWTPAGVGLTRTWHADGQAIAGATAATYVPVEADRGKVITLAVTATKPGYRAAHQASAATAPVLGRDEPVPNVLKSTAAIAVQPDGRGTVNVSCTTACSGWVQVWSDRDGTTKSDVRTYSLQKAGWMPLAFTAIPYAESADARVRLAIATPRPAAGATVQFNSLALTRIVPPPKNVVHSTAAITVQPDGRGTVNVSCTTACSGWVQVWSDRDGTKKSDVRTYSLPKAGWMPVAFRALPDVDSTAALVRIAKAAPMEAPSPQFNPLTLRRAANAVTTTRTVVVNRDGSGVVNVACTRACSGYVQVWSDSSGTLTSDVQRYSLPQAGWMPLRFVRLPHLATADARTRIAITAPVDGRSPQFNALTLATS